MYVCVCVFVSKYIASNISTINERKNQLTIYCRRHKKRAGAWAKNLY